MNTALVPPPFRWGLALGPLVGMVIWMLPEIPELSGVGQRVLGVAAWTAIWWMTEALPICATALLPFLLFPLLGVMDAPTAARASTDDTLYLFLGGFCLGAALERWGLHRRLALTTLILVGGGTRTLILGVMCVVAFLSMWLTNTATTAMMIPILLAIVQESERKNGTEATAPFGAALLLGTALAANIGGMGTPVGTVPNAVLISQLAKRGIEISFLDWMVTAMPIVIILVPLAWWLLVRWTLRVPTSLNLGRRDELESARRELGPLSSAEKRVGAVFLLAVLLWITRRDLTFPGLTIPGWSRGLSAAGLLTPEQASGIRDGSVAVLASLILFALPASRRGPRLLDWKDVQQVPWGVLFLLGGGMCLAEGFIREDPAGGMSVTEWLGHQLGAFQDLPRMSQFVAICPGVSLLTEFASNTATCTLLLPIMLPLAAAAGEDVVPYGFAIALSASCSFMMPVATPPNALAFGTGRIPMKQMIRNGLVLNLLAALTVSMVIGRG